MALTSEAIEARLNVAQNHAHNIDREMEVLRNSIIELCNFFAFDFFKAPEHAFYRARVLQIRENLDSIYARRESR